MFHRSPDPRSHPAGTVTAVDLAVFDRVDRSVHAGAVPELALLAAAGRSPQPEPGPGRQLPVAGPAR